MKTMDDKGFDAACDANISALSLALSRLQILIEEEAENDAEMNSLLGRVRRRISETASDEMQNTLANLTTNERAVRGKGFKALSEDKPEPVTESIPTPRPPAFRSETEDE